MEIIWFVDPLERIMVIQTLNGDSEEELKELLDTIYYKVAEDLKTTHFGDLTKPKPVVKFLPFIKRSETFNPDTGVIESYEEVGMCRQKDVLIAVGIKMKFAIIHEFVHWLRPDLKEKEAHLATEQLIKLWKLREGKE